MNFEIKRLKQSGKMIDKKIGKKLISGIFIILILVMIWQTKSRFAFLGIGFWFLFLCSLWLWNKFFGILDSKAIKKSFFWQSEISVYSFYVNLRRIWFALVIFLPIFVGIVAINLPSEVLNKLPVEIAKPSSTFWHAMRTGSTLELIQENSSKWALGFGLGASGPAAKLEYYDIKKAEIFAKNELIAYKYRLVGEDLTIPENWFLQVFVNGGIVYFLLYLCVLLAAIKPLGTIFGESCQTRKRVYQKQGLDLQPNLDPNSSIIRPILYPNSQIFKSAFEDNQTFLETSNNTNLENNSTNLSNLSKFFEIKINRSILVSLAFFSILVGNLFLHLFEAQIIVLYWSLIYLWANLPSFLDKKLEHFATELNQVFEKKRL